VLGGFSACQDPYPPRIEERRGCGGVESEKCGTGNMDVVATLCFRAFPAPLVMFEVMAAVPVGVV